MEVITSKSNDKIKLASALMAGADKRKETGLFLLEGARLCLDAVKSPVVIESLFVTPDALSRLNNEVSVIAGKAAAVYRIDDGLASKISDTKHPQGVFCICKTLDKTEDIYKMDKDGKYLALEEVSNPLNLGSACRSAEAFGLNGIIVSGGCDIYNPKAQRAAMGSLLRLPVFETDDMPKLLLELAKTGMKTFAAVVESDAVDIRNADFSGGAVCAVGNEGAGLKPETANAAQSRITIKMRGETESLNANAAAAVIMWEMMK